MFPQLVAGPIVRYSTIASQLRRRVITSRHVYFGATVFVFGLAQKVLIADTMAGIADPLFDAWKILSLEASWIAVICYTFQIYFDFGGYSNMAIGLAMMCGFRFPENFNYPYISQSITEFWRRWHMSLSKWFRDYLYIPMGGNRHGPARTYFNLFTVFLLCGLWHGAAWTFVLWGIYHGLLLVIERIGLGNLLERLPRVLRHGYAMLAIMIGWVLFRSESMDQVTGMLSRMFMLMPSNEMPIEQILTGEGAATIVAAAIFSTPVVVNLLRSWIGMPAEYKRACRRTTASAYAMGSIVGMILFSASLVKIFTGSYSPFIYFRF